MYVMFSFAELPGYYYDAEKNRYFPLKGPIPGSSRKRKSSSSSSSAGNGKNSVPQPNQVLEFFFLFFEFLVVQVAMISLLF